MAEPVVVRRFADGAQITLARRGVRVVVFHHPDRLMLHTVDPIDGVYVIREAAFEPEQPVAPHGPGSG